MNEQIIRDKITEILNNNTQEMEGYCYFGSNPVISSDDYDDVVNEVIRCIIDPLLEKLERLQKENTEINWVINPDRMGQW